MGKRWYKVWPSWVPRTFAVDKPASEYVREWAERTPERTAISFYGRDITYRELDSSMDAIARGLVGLGVGAGDRVALHMDNCPQFVMGYFGILRAGGVVVPVNPMFKPAELDHELNDSGATVLIGLDYLYPDVEKVRSRTPLKKVILTSLEAYFPEKPVLPLPPEAGKTVGPFTDTLSFEELISNNSEGEPLCRVSDLKNELAVLQYTGGTTGMPKGAMISHYALSSSSFMMLHWYHHRENDVFLGVTPFFHVMGQINVMCTPLVAGGRIVILSRFIPAVVAQAITVYRCTYWVAPTTAVIALLSLPNLKDYDFSSFRCLWTGGVPISTELQKQLNALMPDTIIGEGYGLSETMSSGGACTPLYRHKSGFVGIPESNVDLKIVDRETGKELEANQEGEIVIKCDSMMLGYWNKPEESAEVIRDGWLHTGDVGLMDEEGYVKFLGRSRELIKCSGYSVFPVEVENLLYQHPAVKEAAVIGVVDPYRGETPKAFIVLKDEYVGKIAEEEILEWCKENMSAYKRPRVVEFKEGLPKSAAGKLLKRILSQQEAEANKARA